MKNKWISLLLCFFFGWLGVHRFYERKIPTGILYLCTLGLLGIGWIYDLWLLLIKPNKPITESYQYDTYLEVVEALQKNGYTIISEEEWCLIRAYVSRDSVHCGEIFVVADPKPGLLSYLVGSAFPQYDKHRYEATEYGAWKRRFELAQRRLERNGYNTNSYYYWPDDSFIAGRAEYRGEPTEDNEWLNILKSVIG